MNRKARLLQEQASLVEERGKLLDLWEAESREPTDREMKRCNQIKARLKGVDDEVEIASQRDERLRQTKNFNHDLEPLEGGGVDRAHRQRYGGNGHNGRSGTPSFRALFPDVRIESGGFESAEAFFHAADQASRGLGNDPRLLAVQTGGTPSAGGFSVPTEFSSQMLDDAIEETAFVSRARIEPMTSDERKVWGFDAKTSTTTPATLFGGLSPRWTAEAASITSTDAVLRSITLRAYKLALFSQSSNELIDDGLNFEQQLAEAFQKSMAWALDWAALNGTGAGQPSGVLNDGALIVVPKETGQAANTILYTNVVKMFSRLHPALVQNAIWIGNSNTIPELLQLSVVVGTAGSHVPVLKEDSGSFSMLGRPCFFTEKLPTLGTQSDLIFVDPSQWILGLRSEMRLDRSMHLGFQSDLDSWRGIIRADGMGSWNAVYTPAAGSTLSWCVSLAVRA